MERTPAVVRYLLVLALLTLLGGQAASTFAAPPATEAGGTVIPLTYGWYEGRSTFYYSFENPVPSPDGGETITPAPIYVFFYGNGDPVPGQHNIIDVVPGDAGYSDLWQVHQVTVPDDYTADSIRSYSDLQSAGYPITPLEMYVNCPVVPQGTTLQYSQQGLTQGWYQGSEVYYFDFGLNPTTSAPIYVLFHENGDMVAGQHNIINTIPGESGYSAFWRVHRVTVPNDYVANSARSLTDIMNAGYPIQATDMLVNCPVVRTEEPATTFDLTEGWYRNIAVTYYSFSNPIPSPDSGETITPAPIYVLFYENGEMVPGQSNIIDVVPGDEGYSAFWQVHRVTVPNDYEANSIRSAAELMAAGYPVMATDMLVNCPVNEVAPTAITIANFEGNRGALDGALLWAVGVLGAVGLLGLGFRRMRRR